MDHLFPEMVSLYPGLGESLGELPPSDLQECGLGYYRGPSQSIPRGGVLLHHPLRHPVGQGFFYFVGGFDFFEVVAPLGFLEHPFLLLQSIKHYDINSR